VATHSRVEQPSPEGSTRPPRAPLTRSRILDAAVDYVDRNCLADLSMRKLGAQLGVEAMALYWHVPNKAALLEGVAELLMSRLDVPAAGDPDWERGVRRFAASVRLLAREHPRIFPLLPNAARGTPEMRRVLGGLDAMWRAAGLDEQHAFRASWAVHGYVMGVTLWELAMTSEGGAETAGPLSAACDAAFQSGLELIIDGLRAQLLGADQRGRSSSVTS